MPVLYPHQDLLIPVQHPILPVQQLPFLLGYQADLFLHHEKNSHSTLPIGFKDCRRIPPVYGVCGNAYVISYILQFLKTQR